MIAENLSTIKALAFDFGGTLDAPFLHWLDIYLMAYAEALGKPLERDVFYESYVYGERQMESQQLVNREHSLLETQLFKTHLQTAHLIERKVLDDTLYNREELPKHVAEWVTDYSAGYVRRNEPVLRKLSEKYTLLLVSNYYGNIRRIATDLHIADCFRSITDSTIEGVRKPDPKLWELAIQRAGFRPEEVVVIGDSTKNDILPALSLGCHTVQGYPESIKPEKIDLSRDYIFSIEELLPLLLG